MQNRSRMHRPGYNPIIVEIDFKEIANDKMFNTKKELLKKGIVQKIQDEYIINKDGIMDAGNKKHTFDIEEE